MTDRLTPSVGATAPALVKPIARKVPTAPGRPAEEFDIAHISDGHPNGDARPARPRYTIYDDVEIEALPEPAALIDGVLFAGTLAVILGKYESFKSFLALAWAFHIATERPWCGREIVRGGWVLYIYAEGTHGIRRRVAAWKASEDYTGRAGVRFIPSTVVMTDAASVAALVEQLRADYDSAPVAIFIDTVNRNFAGNENSAEDMGRFVAGCDRLRECFGCAVVGVHHTGWEATERSRGSTVLPGAVDTEIVCVREGTRLTIRCGKQKDAAHFPAMHLEAWPVLGSLVLRSNEPAGPAIDDWTENQRKSLALVQSHFGDGGATAGEWQTVTSEKAKMARSSFYAARTALVEGGYVEKRGSRYHVTDAGRARLGLPASPKSNGSPTAVQPAGVDQVQRAGGSRRPPALDHRSDDDSDLWEVER